MMKTNSFSFWDTLEIHEITFSFMTYLSFYITQKNKLRNRLCVIRFVSSCYDNGDGENKRCCLISFVTKH